MKCNRVVSDSSSDDDRFDIGALEEVDRTFRATVEETDTINNRSPMACSRKTSVPDKTESKIKSTRYITTNMFIAKLIY